MLEFYDMNFYSNSVKASGFLKSIPLWILGWCYAHVHMEIAKEYS